jgi:hypothetical protein
LPWHSRITGLWLGQGGRRAVLRETVSGEQGALSIRSALSAVDFAGEPTRQEIAAHARSTAVSLDWHTFAAKVSTPDNGHEVVVWDARARAVTTRVNGLSPEESGGTVGLDGAGATLLLSWRDDFDTSTTDVRELAGTPRNHLSTWALPTGAKQGTVSHDLIWPDLVPLADLASGPLALISTSTIGVLLPRAEQPSPLRRLTEGPERERLDTEEIMDRLCGLLADPNTDEAVQELVPQDAYQGDVCPS